jgi:hypothetical protein
VRQAHALPPIGQLGAVRLRDLEQLLELFTVNNINSHQQPT